MKIKILFFFFFIEILSCQNREINADKAVSFHKKASDIFKNNINKNNDSLIYAVSLLDSAIYYDSTNLRFYFTKCQISMKVKRYDLVINSCNKILSINKSNYVATLEKGVAFELANNIDSAMNTYNLALISLDNTKFENSIFKEYQRVILCGLLKDSTTFNIKLNQFRERFKDNKEFTVYYEDLIHFNRTTYINSY